MSPGPERGERDRAPVRVAAHRPRVARADDVAGVAGVALAEHRLPRLEVARHGDLRDPLEVGWLERRERGHAARAARPRRLSASLPFPREYHNEPRGASWPAAGISPAPGALAGAIVIHMLFSKPISAFPTAAAALAAALALGASATAQARSASAKKGTPTASERALLHSHELWATIDVCDPADQPDTVGVRGSMPGDGNAHDRMYMSFRLQYLDSATKAWVEPRERRELAASWRSAAAPRRARRERASN